MITVPTVHVPSHRVKLISITPELLVEWWKGMDTPRMLSAKGLPADALVVNCAFDIERGLIRILIASKTFPELPAGERAPELIVEFTEHYEGVAVHR